MTLILRSVWASLAQGEQRGNISNSQVMCLGFLPHFSDVIDKSKSKGLRRALGPELQNPEGQSLYYLTRKATGNG